MVFKKCKEIQKKSDRGSPNIAKSFFTKNSAIYPFTDGTPSQKRLLSL
jgi:hypothetical protein